MNQQVTSDVLSEPQLVRWGPVDNKPPGIQAEGESGVSFVPWDQLKVEIETMLLPQVRVLPIGSTAELRDLGDRLNWIVRVLAPNGGDVADVWFGTDGENGWQWDGLVRVGNAKPTSNSRLVWQTFQRYSDGSYRRIEARVIDKVDTGKKIGFP